VGRQRARAHAAQLRPDDLAALGAGAMIVEVSFRTRRTSSSSPRSARPFGRRGGRSKWSAAAARPGPNAVVRLESRASLKKVTRVARFPRGRRPSSARVRETPDWGDAEDGGSSVTFRRPRPAAAGCAAGLVPQQPDRLAESSIYKSTMYDASCQRGGPALAIIGPPRWADSRHFLATAGAVLVLATAPLARLRPPQACKISNLGPLKSSAAGQ